VVLCSIWFSVLCVLSVLWHCWLGHLTRKNSSPYDLYCVGGMLSLTQSINQSWESIIMKVYLSRSSNTDNLCAHIHVSSCFMLYLCCTGNTRVKGVTSMITLSDHLSTLNRNIVQLCCIRRTSAAPSAHTIWHCDTYTRPTISRLHSSVWIHWFIWCFIILDVGMVTALHISTKLFYVEPG